ncbi:hypothetical protein EJ06DRAFT_531323 [Trichodelitschia bisporula]|uniref:Uncharacterized protein n=1 Tax=Trichodelitschia bisporula TaxID=703511 RepID=A0A6G1HSW7_9PEZI|nr:hypothetical protein EJ06DRAFT_531323 [Trichodelitschia bisporula]
MLIPVAKARFMLRNKSLSEEPLLLRILLPKVHSHKHTRPPLRHKPIHLLKALCFVEPVSRSAYRLT